MFDVLVIGAGVSGLTTAVCLAEAGLRVHVVAKDPPLQTTSAAAGATWGPYLADDSRVAGWSLLTRLTLETVAAHSPLAGVRLVRGLEVDAHATGPPAWARSIPDFALADQVPPGYGVGWWFTAPVVNMLQYLVYLENRLARHGANIETAKVISFSEVEDLARLIVNCTGLGARELAGDPLVRPIRGQLVVLPNPGIDYFFQDSGESEEFTYFLPHGATVVLGGCAIPDDESTEPDPALAARIIDRCAAIEPSLAGLDVLELRTGVRPARGRVRLEIDWEAGRPIIHNYGHGGAGLTLSWGCAAQVLTHAQALLRQ
jgi:D-amino-acid oxidase